MPQYEPLPSLAGLPFSLIVPGIQGIGPTNPSFESAGEALAEFIRTFPVPGGIGEVIAAEVKERIVEIPGLPVYEIPWEGVTGAWITKAMSMAKFPRTLILPPGEGQGLPGGNDLKILADKLEMAHLVLLPRPQKNWHPVPRKFWDLCMWMRKWIFALEPKGDPKWPGLEPWFRRLVSRWILGAPGEDPDSPIRMVRSSLIRGMDFQSGGNFVWVEMLAKATFLGALVEELPVPSKGSKSKAKEYAEIPGPDWWTDFRTVFGDPQFGKPWSPLSQEGEKTESDTRTVTQVLF